jgi:hypothetical protein
MPLFGKEGEGRFYESLMKTFVLKIPLYPPLPKGYDIFMLLCEPEAHIDSCESRPTTRRESREERYWIPHQVRNDKVNILRYCCGID